MNSKIKMEIKTTIESSIENFFKDKKVEVTHVLDILFPVERRIRSLIGGLKLVLNNCLGTYSKTLVKIMVLSA